jgi:SAM-dependent methyltransferase
VRLKPYLRMVKYRMEFASFRLTTFLAKNQTFECPVCSYCGPFMSMRPSTGLRKHAKCPNCRALERHRLEYLVIRDALKDRNLAQMKMLHFAPEDCFRPLFEAQFGQYNSADLNIRGVDFNVDIRELPFEDASYDFVLASVVLDYVPDDKKAIKEIRRILRPNGIAILPVALACEKTIEYAEPNPYEAYHIRASGMDYFDRFEPYFSKVERIASHAFPEKHQLFVYEDRSMWPTETSPLRPKMLGEKHVNIIPVCYV